MLKRIAPVVLFLTLLAAPLTAAPEAGAPPNHAAVIEKPDVAEAEHGLMDFDWQSAVWTLIIFLILLAVLYKTAWKQVLGALKKREERIRNDIALAEAARRKAEAALAEYNAQLASAESRGREILAKAVADAQGIAERIKLDADQAARERVERATREIEDARNQAVREIYEKAADLSTSIAEKILRRNLNADDQRDLVTQSLEELEALNRG